MTVRDEFAARAMQGILTYSGPGVASAETLSCESVALWAYEMADAMMEEREKHAG
jgi:hypothetical protein